MTFRERLADWISGGAWTRAHKDWLEEYKVSRRRAKALHAIHAATCNGKSGTAQKIARMARKGLK